MSGLCVAVIIPVGPGHTELAQEAIISVQRAWKHNTGPFEWLDLLPIMDSAGALGRSKARNIGMGLANTSYHPPDYYFFLDADDTMELGALGLVDLKASATFGAVCLDGKVSRYSGENVYPLSRYQLLRLGSRGTLSMGCFVRADLGLRFDEGLDVGEDFDFYCRLPDFTKRQEPLVNIGYKRNPSAGGPRSSKKCDWTAACDKVVAGYRLPLQLRGGNDGVGSNRDPGAHTPKT